MTIKFKLKQGKLPKAGISVTSKQGLDFGEFFAQEIQLSKFTEMLKEEHFKPRRYTKDEINNFLEKPENFQSQLRAVSQYLYLTSSHYRRIISYFATMLTFDYVVVPWNVPGAKIQSDQFRRNYENAAWFMELFNPKHELSKIAMILLTEGVFFGVEWQTKDSFMIQRLPSDYCRISGLQDNTWMFAFDLDYFSQDEEKLENYPPIFTSMYRAYQRDREMQWQIVDPSIGVCFKYDETILTSVPPFVGIFEDIMDLREYKALAKSKTRIENYKLLVQKIPFKKEPKSDKDFLIGIKSVRTFHGAIRKALPQGVDVVSTPMDLESYNFEKSRQPEDTVGNAERSVYGTAGVSQLLFNSDKSGSVGLNRSIEADEAEMFKLLKQFERYLTKRLTTKVTKGAYLMRVRFPEITVYNREKVYEFHMKAAQFGFPISDAVAALGYTTNELISLANLENSYLNIKDLLIPLSSSHTATGDGDSGGRPRKSDDDLGEDGEETRDSGANEDRKAAE